MQTDLAADACSTTRELLPAPELRVELASHSAFAASEHRRGVEVQKNIARYAASAARHHRMRVDDNFGTAVVVGGTAGPAVTGQGSIWTVHGRSDAQKS